MARFTQFIAALAVTLLGACDLDPRLAGIEPVAREQLFTYEETEQQALSAFCPVDTTSLFPFSLEELASDALETGYFSRGTPADDRPRCRSGRNWEHHATLGFDLSSVVRREDLDRLSGITVLADRRAVDPPQACADDAAAPVGPELAGLLVSPGYPRTNLDAALLPSVLDGTPMLPRGLPGTQIVDGTRRDWRFRYHDRLDSDVGSDRPEGRRGGTFVVSAARVAEIRDALIAFRDGAAADAFVYVVFVGRENADITSSKNCRARYSRIRLALTFDPAP